MIEWTRKSEKDDGKWESVQKTPDLLHFPKRLQQRSARVCLAPTLHRKTRPLGRVHNEDSASNDQWQNSRGSGREEWEKVKTGIWDLSIVVPIHTVIHREKKNKHEDPENPFRIPNHPPCLEPSSSR